MEAESLSCSNSHPIAARTKPPATWTTGSEMPKNRSTAEPTSSMTKKKRVVETAILRARLLMTSDGTNPTSPRKTRADPRGLTTGSSAVKARPKNLRTVSILAVNSIALPVPRERSRHRLLQMHGRIGTLRFWGILAALCNRSRLSHGVVGRSVLGLDLVAPRLAIHAARCRLGRGHRRIHGDLSIRFELPLDAGNQFFVFCVGQPLFLVHQIIFQPGNRIAPLPILKQRLWNVLRRIVNGVSFHAHHFRFDQRRTSAAPRPFAGFVAGVVDLASVSAIDDHAGDAVGDGALGQILDAKLHVGGRGISPKIVLDDQDQAEILDGCEIQAFEVTP